jgi:hypothetical protein
LNVLSQYRHQCSRYPPLCSRRYNWRGNLSFSFNLLALEHPNGSFPAHHGQHVLKDNHVSPLPNGYTNDLLQHYRVAINQFGTISSVIPWILWQFDSKFVPCRNPFWQNHVKSRKSVSSNHYQ